MGIPRKEAISLLDFILIAWLFAITSDAQAIVPALITFADSLGFTSYPLAYLSPRASGKNLLIGASFASAASGYDDRTAHLNNALSISQQVKHFQEYIKKLERIAGPKNASLIIKDALYVIGFGTADFNQNYYINPAINKVYTPDQYSSYLIGKFSSFIKDLYGLGARRIGVTSLPPLGCTPAARILYGRPHGQGGCVAKQNRDALLFNMKLNHTSSRLLKQLPGLKLAVFDIFKPFYDFIKSPSDYGFKETTRGCCRTGAVQNTAFLCNKRLRGTCRNATEYVFWDGVHLSEAANQFVADSLISQGISLII
ncbi:OLC1v1014911C1 [Oldenlandia corymbosa var. corymbosa]|uniref:OLC1v1014911C1 n=1 Tax=Oldenlandia corymbosa var. corymbosa TaxID=529605 RepID=A0AAV1E5R4_OLDCO|nr:OLC1v1014911C1 [Oldenlandia corymbosa var. corymbosa]